MIEECRGKSNKERLKFLGLTILETRKIRADMLEVYKILNGFEGLREDSFSRYMAYCTKTKGHSRKLYKSRVNKDLLKFSTLAWETGSFDQWNMLYQRRLLGL